MADMSISCRSDRYKQTSIFVWIMVAIYPIGVPLAALYVLFVHRRQINPKVKIDAANAAGTDNKRGRLFKVCSMRQMERDIDERNKKKELKAFSFLFEEYEPRCWWYAVAELIFRLYLTGLISFFGSSHSPATTTQTSLGLFGAIIYYVVLSAFDPRAAEWTSSSPSSPQNIHVVAAAPPRISTSWPWRRCDPSEYLLAGTSTHATTRWPRSPASKSF